MENEVRKYEKYKNNLKLVLATSGVWPDYEGHSPALRKFLSFCSIFASGFTFCCILAYCIKCSNNIQIFTSCLGLMIGFFAAFIKICVLCTHEKTLKSLNQGISARFEKDLQIIENQPYLLQHFPVFFKMYNTLRVSVALAVILLIVMPLLMLRHSKYLRMYPQLLPFSYEQKDVVSLLKQGGLVHWIIYLFEMYCGFYLWSVTCAVDSVFGLYALHIVGQLRLLSLRFQRLKASMKYQVDLKDCILNHYFIVSSQHSLEKVFSFLTIWLAVTCAISLCGLVFQATQLENISAVRVLYLSCHVFIKLAQAYCYSWYGSIITIESTLCLNAVYNAKWPGSGNSRFMNDILIVLLQKPMSFRVMDFMDLRLDMFLKILNASVSYFFLLRTLAAKPS